MRVAEDRSIFDDQGRILFYSAERFLREIVEGNCCFICGAAPGSVPFNDEHVVPDWILRKFDLHDKRIVVPGGSELLYGRYKVPCCLSCNSRLGDVFEKPIAEIVSRGYEAVIEHLRTEGPLLFFAWFNLIFLKTHLKDRGLLINRDPRANSGMIAELYEWPELHHIHCMARAFYTGAALTDKALSSMLVFPAKVGTPLGDFDYADYLPGRALLIRIGEIGFIAVLNDACAAINILRETMARVTGPLSGLQWRELLAHFSYANLLLKHRPQFFTRIDVDSNSLTIAADVPEVIESEDFIADKFGEILYSVMAPSLDVIPLPEPQVTREHIRAGRWSFLFDGEGGFVRNAL